MREENLKLCDQLIHNSLIGWWWNYRAIVVSLLKLLQAWGLCAHGHQEVSFFHLVEVLASVKLKQKTKILFAEPKIEFYKLTVTQAKFMLKCWDEVIRPFSWLITLQNIFYTGSTLIPRSFSGIYFSHVNPFSKPACQGKWNGLVDKIGRWGKAGFSSVKARCCVTGNLPLPFPHSYLRNGEKD